MKRALMQSMSLGASLSILLVESAGAQPKPSPPTTFLASDPPGAEVRIDGVRRGNTSLELTQNELPPGKHAVIFHRNGYADETGVIEVRPGQSLNIPPVLLKPLPRLDVVGGHASSQGALLLIDDLEAAMRSSSMPRRWTFPPEAKRGFCIRSSLLFRAP